MPIAPGSVEHLSKIISHVVVPAFLLGAMASFVSILTTRMSAVQDRICEVGRTEGDDHVTGHVKIDIPHLRRRMKLLHSAFILAMAGGVVTCTLLTGAFSVALLGYQHVGFAAVIFMISMCLLFVALVIPSVEVGSEHAYPLTSRSAGTGQGLVTGLCGRQEFFREFNFELIYRKAHPPCGL